MEPIVNDSTSDLSNDELTDKDVLNRYKMEIQLYDKEYKTWETRSNKIIRRYRDERVSSQTSATRFNILYSNIQTLFPAAYGHDPKPDIQRRFKDDDVLGRVTSDVLERCTAFSINSKFSDAVKHALHDRLLPGRGIVWTRYEPHFRDVALPQQSSDGQITDDAYSEEDPLQEVYYEEVCHDYVHWKDFGHNVARVWDEVYCGWRKAFLTKDELIERFGDEIATLCPMDYSPKGLSDEKISEPMKKSTIYELWDKNKKKVYWVHKDLDQFLDVKDDPLGLPEFFPFPKPLFGILTNDSLIPVPDYVQYQDQAMELDEITGRISAITKAIKVVGVYDSSAAGVERMLNEGVENKLIAVESWAVFGEKGGLQGAMQLMPMKELAEVLLSLYEAREKVKNDLYEITGIADIIRGATKASETATAQNIKSQFATLRLDTIQHSVARFARDMVVNTALIIAGHFSLDTIKQISGVQLMTAQEKQQFQAKQQQYQMAAQQAQAQQMPPPPAPPPIDEKTQELLDNPTWEEVYQLLQDQPHLTFRIDIETDSTIKMDEQQDQQARMEFLTAAGGFIQQAAEVQNPELMPLLVQMLLFGVRGFKVGKGIEGTFRTILQKVEKQAQQPQQPKPDPEMAKVESEAKLKQQDQAHSQGIEKQNQDFEQKKTAAESQQDHAQTMAKIAADRDVEITKSNNEAALEQQRMDKELSTQREIAMFKALTEASVKKMTAKITADAQAKEAQEEAVESEPDNMAPLIEQMGKLVESMGAPSEITLDNGRKATVRRGPN